MCFILLQMLCIIHPKYSLFLETESSMILHDVRNSAWTCIMWSCTKSSM